jgi:homoserine kinase type II
MALLTPLGLDEARVLGRSYGVELQALEPLSLGSVNSNFRARSEDGRALFARLYEEQDERGAAAETALAAALARAGIPVTEALPLTGTLPVHAGKPFVVFPWITGEILCFGRVTEDACRKLGHALARVHLASATLPPLGPGRFRPLDMRKRLGEVERSASGAALRDHVHQVQFLYEHWENQRVAGLPSGIVHGDLFRDNVLWQNGEIAALLDFESAFHGPFAYDLMVTISAWCYGDAFDLALVRALFEGYTSTRPLTDAERRALPVEGALGCLRFATSRITDFELRASPGERPARDFRRFLTRLDAIVSGQLASVLG